MGVFFFFQAEDGIRDGRVTGVQTCALPIWRFGDRYVISADRVFDGTRVLEDHAVTVWGDRIAAVAPADRLPGQGEVIRFAGTLLPGFIDLHGHPLLGQVPPETMLRHGITTIRDTGGPLVAPSGCDGRLRVLAAGPILTARSEEHTSELQSPVH